MTLGALFCPTHFFTNLSPSWTLFILEMAFEFQCHRTSMYSCCQPRETKAEGVLCALTRQEQIVFFVQNHDRSFRSQPNIHVSYILRFDQPRSNHQSGSPRSLDLLVRSHKFARKVLTSNACGFAARPAPLLGLNYLAISNAWQEPALRLHVATTKKSHLAASFWALFFAQRCQASMFQLL